MIGVELRDPASTDGVLETLKDAGLLIGKTGPGRNVLTFMPPLIVNRDDLDNVVDKVDHALRFPEVR